MNQRELLTISIGIFLTIIAWMIIDLYHVQQSRTFQGTLGGVQVPSISINSKMFEVLKNKVP